MATSKTIELEGVLSIGGDDCGCASDGENVTRRSLALRCSQYYQAAQSTDVPVRVATLGAIGSAWVDMPCTGGLISIEFLMLKSTQPVRVRIGAAPAKVTGSGGVFPTGFVGAETLTLTIDGVAVSVAFLSGDQTAAQVAARINAAAALAGLTAPRCVVASSGQLEISGVLTGTQGSVNITGGTGRATLGLATGIVYGSGADHDVYGLFVNEFPSYPDAPSRIQISGQATISVVAAGRTAA